jgi:hypothetical protein
MGAASATISPLGLDLDLIEHRVLMRSARMAGAGGEMDACEREAAQSCGSYGSDGDSDARKKWASRSIYRGVHPISSLWFLPPYDAHYNGSILIKSREDRAGFFANRLSNDLKLRV